MRAAVPEEFVVISAGEWETADRRPRSSRRRGSLVQGYTGFLYRGPLWARQINRGLARAR